MGEELRLPLCDRGPWVPATTTGNSGRGLGGGPRVGPPELKSDRVTKPYLKLDTHLLT